MSGTVNWIGPFRDPRQIKPPSPVRTASPKADPDVRYVPAKLEVRQRPAELSADWSEVWENMGVLRPTSFARRQADKSQAVLAEDIQYDVRNGDRTRDIHKEKGNIFGKIAFETYMRKSRADTTIVTAPNFGPKIDVRVHPPEIRVQAETVLIGRPKGR